MSVQKIASAIGKLNDISRKFEENFGNLSKEELNMKISPQDWSIGQCIDHLTVSNMSYFPQLRAAASGNLQSGFWARMPLLPGMFGKMLKRSVSPVEKKKFKTMKPFEPSYSDINAGVVKSFVEIQNELCEMISKLDRTDLQKTIITSPASSFITYSLEDLLDILALHEERHFRQAMRTAEHFGIMSSPH